MASYNIEEIFNSLAYYNIDYNILVCKIHSYAIKKSNLKTHLTSLHSADHSPKITKELVLFGLNLYSGEPIYPRESISPIPYLKIKDPSYQCLWSIRDNPPCGYILGDLRHLINHCSDKHKAEGWVNNRKRGRNSTIKRDTLPPSIIKIIAQAFFNTGTGNRYFRVLENSNSPPIAIENGENSGEILFQSISQKLDLRLRSLEHPNRAELGENLAENEPNPWLERTGWAKHLAGFDLEEIISYIKFPDPEDEPESTLLIKLVNGLIFRAYKNARPDSIGLASLEYINRKESGENSNEKPLSTQLEHATILKYAKNWAKIALYLYNSYNISPPNRPSYIWTEKQLKKLRKVRLSISSYIK